MAAEDQDVPPALGLAEDLVGSAEFQNLVQGFEKATGLKLHAYTATAVPLDVPFQPTPLCQSLQKGMDCPLYFDPNYHTADEPELRATCGGLGHALIPVKAADGTPLLTLVTETVRFGPVDMELITAKAFRHKIFPDVLAAQAESAPLVPRETVQFASQVLFAGLHELVDGQTGRTRAITLMIHKIAGSDTDEVADAILAAALEFCNADYAYFSLLGAGGDVVAESGTPDTREARFRILQGVGRWVVYAGDTVDIPDTRYSAWCRHLAHEDHPPPGAIVGMPLVFRGDVFGGIVVGGADHHRLHEWTSALKVFTEAGGDALILARRLVEVGDGSMLDRSTGAYNLRFLEELLEKEISRADRHNHELSLVLFHLANYAELLSRVGNDRAEFVLGQVVELIRSKTRKVNSLARVNETDFCLVIPEAAQEVAEKIADELSALAQGTDYMTDVNGGRSRIKVSLETRTAANPAAADAAIESLVASLN